MKTFNFSLLFYVILSILISVNAIAHEIYLKDGRIIEVDSYNEDESTVTYYKYGASITLSKDKIQKINHVDEKESKAGDFSKSSDDYDAIFKAIDEQYAGINTSKKCRDTCVEDFNKSAKDDYAHRKYYVCYHGYCEEKFPPYSSYTIRNIQVYKKLKTKADCLRQCQKKYEIWMKSPCPPADRVRTGNFNPPCTYKALQDKNRCLFFCDKAFKE